MASSETDTAGSSASNAAQEVPDEDLDRLILTRLTLLGVDLSVLPEDDPDAPADQRRILASARRFLRSTPQALADFPMDPQEVAPIMYPAALAPDRSGGDLAPRRDGGATGSGG